MKNDYASAVPAKNGAGAASEGRTLSAPADGSQPGGLVLEDSQGRRRCLPAAAPRLNPDAGPASSSPPLL